MGQINRRLTNSPYDRLTVERSSGVPNGSSRAEERSLWLVGEAFTCIPGSAFRLLEVLFLVTKERICRETLRWSLDSRDLW